MYQSLEPYTRTYITNTHHIDRVAAHAHGICSIDFIRVGCVPYSVSKMMSVYLLFYEHFFANNVAELFFLSFLSFLRFIIVFVRADGIMGELKARVRILWTIMQKLKNVTFNV